MMMNESLRKRLEALNRAPLAETPRQPSEAELQTDAGPQQPHAMAPRGAFARASKTPTIGPVLPHAEQITNDAGQHLQIDIPLERLWPHGEQLCEARRQFLNQQLAAEARDSDAGTSFHPEFCQLIQTNPKRTIYFDLETCGLAGSPLFLIGVLVGTEQGHAIRLLLAADYSQEKAVLVSFWDLLASAEVLVSFNGKSFDWPMVIDRSQRFLMFRGIPPVALPHIDILHHARRRWRKVLPDCRLQTLENRICGRVRDDDIPGEQIPAAYAQFVRTGKSTEMELILLHNAIDLVSLLDLTMRLAS